MLLLFERETGYITRKKIKGLFFIEIKNVSISPVYKKIMKNR